MVGNGGSDKPNYVQILKQHNLPKLEVSIDSKAGSEVDKYAMYSWSVQFVTVLVNPITGVVK